ncbi:hypothetical protein PTKIN_Ptkin07bG0280700 [Pterospermum kingtungense]
MGNLKKHFVLVHGICFGAWCWYKVMTLLKSAGHRVTALDLGASGVNPKKLNEISSISDYGQPLMDFMASLPEEEKVVLVGHSYGGMGISLAMEKFPNKISVAVFVTAYMPNHVSPLATLVDQYFKITPKESLLDFQFSFDDGLQNPPTSAIFGPNFLAARLFQCSPKEDLELAKTLVRPTGLFLKDLAKNCLLTKGNFGSVDRVFVLCKEDELFSEDFQRWFIENSPTKDVKVIEGADHMAMLSKPKELCLCFLEIAEEY